MKSKFKAKYFALVAPLLLSSVVQANVINAEFTLVDANPGAFHYVPFVVNTTGDFDFSAWGFSHVFNTTGGDLAAAMAYTSDPMIMLFENPTNVLAPTPGSPLTGLQRGFHDSFDAFDLDSKFSIGGLSVGSYILAVSAGDIPSTDFEDDARTGFSNFTFNAGAEGKVIVNIASVNGNVSVVPVPAAVWFMGTGLLGLVAYRRKNAA